MYNPPLIVAHVLFTGCAIVSVKGERFQPAVDARSQRQGRRSGSDAFGASAVLGIALGAVSTRGSRTSTLF